MKSEIKAAWVAALRSGQYQQGHGHLRNADTYCCLGVLCDLHAKATGNNWKMDCGRGSYFMAGADLPGIVCEWAGLLSRNPDVQIKLKPRPEPYLDNEQLYARALAEVNDGTGEFESRTFAEIADLIEAQISGEVA